MKRKRAEDQEALPASATLSFANLPPDSRRKLDEALHAWADWHADRFPQGYVPPQVETGSVTYAPGIMHLGAGSAAVWEDRPAATGRNGAETLWFNVAYEKVGDVPKYDRGTEDRLAYSARRRPADTLLAAAEAVGVGRPIKRLRSSARCFNCGSYGHSLRDCWRELNRELVEESKRERAESREASGAAYRSAARRYYLQGADGGGAAAAAEQTPGEFADLAPGQLSAELREALGIGPLAPPPWLQRMRDLGLPEGYMEAVRVTVHPAAGAPAADGKPAAGPTEAAAAAAAAAEADLGGDFIPLDSPSASEDGSEPLGDFISLGSPSASEKGSEPVQLECRVQFPGVNAPAPDGADERAWAAAPPPGTAASGHPIGYATPPGAAAAAAAAEAAGARWRQQHSQERPADRSLSRSGSRGGLWQPMRGLHPPQHRAASDSSLARAQDQAVAQATPPPHRGASTPDLPHFPPPPPPPPEEPPLPPGFGRTQQLPPGFGRSPVQQPPVYQQQQELSLPPPPVDVYSVSRSDPGHLLVFDPRGQHPGQQQQQYHAVPPPQQQPWGGMQQHAPWGHQAPPQLHQQHPAQDTYRRHSSGYEQQYMAGGQRRASYDEGSRGSRRQQQEPAPPPQPAAQLTQAQREQQQRLWHSDGRY